MTLKTILTALAVLALTMAGCGGGDTTIEVPDTDDIPLEEPGAEDTGDTGTDDTGDTGAVESVTLEASGTDFTPAEFAVSAGEAEITVENTGDTPHTFTIDELAVDEEIPPGEQVTVTFDAEPGTYDFVCTYHEGAGMVGTMTVTE